jgi:hypothetical protein
MIVNLRDELIAMTSLLLVVSAVISLLAQTKSKSAAFHRFNSIFA